MRSFCGALAGIIILMAAGVAVADGKTLYVSTEGNDAWSGELAAPNAALTDGPVATVTHARDMARGLRAADGPVTVLLRGGVYPQSETVVFTAEDSGTKQSPISYQAYPGEKPVISGGVAISGWQLDTGDQSKKMCNGKLWRTKLPSSKFRFNQLFVNGERRTRARIPNKGSFLRADGPISKNNSKGFFFKEGDLQNWDNMRDIICVVYHSWESSIHHIRSVDTEFSQVTFRESAPWAMGHWEKQQRYYVENVFEGLDEPGEWYLDRTQDALYYYPLPGETMESIQVAAPVVSSTLIRFAGDASKGKSIENLHFKGISFVHANADLKRIRNSGQGEIYQPALIMATGLRNSSFEDCEVAHAGAHGIWMAAGCEDNRIQRCHIHDLGGGGVYIGGGWGVQDDTPVQRIVVDNNFIHDSGHLFHGAHGVWIGKSSYNSVTHNEISNLDYSGISCGWSWGFQPSTAHHNILDFNHIHHIGNGEGLSDMGGIYTLGVSPGTTERNNHIHHIYSYAGVSHGSGIYPDEGSSEILIENNVVYRVRTSPLFMHYGKECLVKNNILAFGGKGQMRRSREDKRCHYIAEGNIVYSDTEQMLDGVWKNGDWKVGRNVYWSTTGEPKFKDMKFAEWKMKGKDADSIVADPLFVDAENGDFSLKPDSPALKLGFKPIDVSQAGLYGADEWVQLPEKYPDRQLNDMPAPVEPPFIINFDFEGEPVNTTPMEGTVQLGGKGSSLQISSDTAASGTQSLRFVDASGQKHSFTPHLFYKPSYSEGALTLSWDMLNSKEAAARFGIEVRQSDESPYLVGPTVWIAADGTVTASHRKIGMIPSGGWVHVDIGFELGEGSSNEYQITLSSEGHDPVTAVVPYVSKGFNKVTWLGIISASDAATVFYIDNLKLGTAEQLKQPPKHRFRGRRSGTEPCKPINKELPMAYWPFADQDGYIALDSSGYGNDGDFWAEWVKGGFGGAAFFDARASRIQVPDNDTLRFGTEDFSIELWMCPTQLEIDSKDKRRRFMSKDNFPNTWWNLNITPEGRIRVEMVDDNKAGASGLSAGMISLNKWTHLAVVVDRTNAQIRFFIDGVLDSTRKISSSFTGSLDVKDGSLSIGSNWQPFIGMLDEIKIYKRVLAESEITAGWEKEKSLRVNTAYEIVE
ncbi:MAG: right-handed parallel beta-helix repeat-containing protein [Kiritimatiellae bacterium]|jgi:hypothetical protein|nr:right-handed parallel beta-helix repeat-containing protein [Kiritimatiellia bacterium]